MTDYRRIYIPGASWFFTVNLLQRRNNHLLIENVDLLRESFRYVQKRKPYTMPGVVILPNHLHCIWTLQADDADYSVRWRLLKAHFSRALPKDERVSKSRLKRRERGIWQRRFWAHLLTSQDDFNNHLDYIHWNPVKHAHAKNVIDWPYSSFHRYHANGDYSADWGHSGQFSIDANE